MNAGLSTLVVALMLIGIVGGAWWFGPGPVGPADDPPLQLAAITNDESTPDAYWPEPLNPVDDPWIATITPEECTAEPISWEKYSAAAATDPGLPDSSFEIVGNPDPEDAEAVVAVLRSWLACADYGNKDQVRTFYTQEALFFKDVSMYNAPYQGEIERRKVEAEQSLARWARESGLYPLSIIAGVEPPEDALVSFEYAQQMLQDSDAMHTGSIVVSPEGTTVPYVEVRFDPADAVLLADGRIMIPTRYVYWAEDPWVQANGFPSEINSSSMAMVLRQVDEEWRIDQTFSIYVCAGGCDYPLIGTDTWPSATPVS